jgi:hypothetical protein
MLNRRVRLLLTLAALTPAGGVSFAVPPPPANPATDADLLEFLGSVDSGADSQAAADDGSWIDYLSKTDISKVAKAADPNDASRPKQPAAGNQPPAAGDPKNE